MRPMKLATYMKEHGLDDATMASLVGGCTEHAVRKWKYGERSPSVTTIVRIEEITAGKVTMRDFLKVEPEAAQ